MTAFKQKSVQLNKNLEAKSKDKNRGNISAQHKGPESNRKMYMCNHSSQKIKYTQATKQMKKMLNFIQEKENHKCNKTQSPCQENISTYQTGKNEKAWWYKIWWQGVSGQAPLHIAGGTINGYNLCESHFRNNFENFSYICLTVISLLDFFLYW